MANRARELARHLSAVLFHSRAPAIAVRTRPRRQVVLALSALVLLLTLTAVTLTAGRRDDAGQRSATAGQNASARAAPSPASLRELASRRGITIGTAVQSRALREDATYRSLLAAEFNGLTFETQLKWDAVEPQRGRYEWSNADVLVAFAKQHNLAMRGHTLVWSSALPRWLIEGAFAPEQLRSILREHIHAVVGRYRGQVAAWDVVNEPLDQTTGELRRSFWYQNLGPDYIADALRWAREADPSAALYVNDFGIENRNRKSDGMYQLVSALRRVGAPIDGVGFQSHLTFESPVATLEENLRRFSELGVDVAITELDVRLSSPATQARRVTAANVYADVLRDCLAVQRCVSFTVWGFADSYSWVPNAYPGWGEACLYDATFTPKPAYQRVRDVLAGPVAAQSPSRVAPTVSAARTSSWPDAVSPRTARPYPPSTAQV